ncbi:MAG: fibronectin type III domain-containing protein, partial [Spirochaetales bacterium]|nr:fibronectin type III domain-containing protein [Spirochaetales bacterium]
MYPAPQNVTVSNVTAGTAYYSSRSISCDIYWETVPEASGYYIYYKAVDYDSWQRINVGNADFYSFNRYVYHNNQTNNKYYFRVDAIIGDGIRVPSEIVIVSVE